MSQTPDPVLRNARREALIIFGAWLASTIYCCAYSYLRGYNRTGRLLGPDDVRPIFGIPSWIFWGVIVPWAASALFTVWFAGYVMVDDDLGSDHASELETEIREGS